MEPGARAAVDGPEPRASSPRARRAWRRLRARVRAVRARARRTPAGRFGWRLGVGVVGGVLLVVGILAIPGPGQGWALVFLSLAILSTEFGWAHRLRQRLWSTLVRSRAWYDSLGTGQRLVAAGCLGLVVVVCLAGAGWLSLWLTGLPGWVPAPVADLLTRVPGVD